MSDCSTRSTYGKLALDIIDDAVFGSFDANSTQYEYVSEAIRMSQVHGGGQGIRGTRSRNKDRVRILSEAVSGPFTLEPTPVEMRLLLQVALGSIAGSGPYTISLAETLPKFGLLIDRVAARFVYDNCRVNKLTISGEQSQPISFTLDIEAETETEDATAFPGTVPAIDTGQPFIFSDTTYSLSADASAAEVMSFTLTIDNVLQTDRFMNSVTRDCIPATDRIITLEMAIPYGADSIDLHDQAIAGAAGTLTLTNGSQSTLFTFENLKSPANTPVTSRRGDEVLHELTMQAYESTSTKELIITHTE